MSTTLDLDVFRRVVRGITVGMLILWSAFLAVQIYDCFIFRWPAFADSPAHPAMPPAYVWIQLTAVGGLLLVGLAVGLRWELPGGLVAIVAAVVLCGWLACWAKRPRRAKRALAAVPAVLLVARRYVDRHPRPGTDRRRRRPSVGRTVAGPLRCRRTTAGGPRSAQRRGVPRAVPLFTWPRSRNGRRRWRGRWESGLAGLV